MNWKAGDLVYVRKDAIPSRHISRWCGVSKREQEPGPGMVISVEPLALNAKRDVCEVYLATSLTCVRFLDCQLEPL